MAKRRPSGDGMIRKKNKKLWEARITIGFKNNGSPMFKYAYGKTQHEALLKLHKLIDEYKGVRLTEESNITVATWLNRWLNDYIVFAVRESTWNSYESAVRIHIVPHIGDKKINLLTTADVQKMYIKLSKEGRVNKTTRKGAGLSDNYIRRIHMMLHQAMEMAVSEKLIIKNPTNGTTIPKRRRDTMKVLNDEQLDRFLEVIRGEEHWRDFFYTVLTTGLRKGEACGLMWSDFDEKKSTLRVTRTVTKKRGGGLIWGDTKTEAGRRTIVLPPSTAEVLKARKAKAKTQWIFHNIYKPEEPMHPDLAYHTLHRLLKKAGLPQIRFHDLRHTFATHAQAGGVDVKTLSNILGHTNASFTIDTYTHVTTDMQKHACEIVGSFIDEFMVV